MTSKPLLHKATSARLKSICKHPPHGLLLIGPVGSGKSTTANWLASKVLGVATDALDRYPYFVRIAPINRTISIEAVRELEHLLSLKPASKSTGIGRIILIEDAQLLTTEAQNALLKTLEEPPAGTMMLLTAARTELLLPTVQSRLQVLHIGRPDTAELQSLLSASGVPSKDINTIMAVSGGLPGLAMTIATGDESHPMVEAAQTARILLQKSAFERLSLVDKLSKDREKCLDVTYILMQMAHAGALSGKAVDRWLRVMQASYEAQAALYKSGQPKLVLTNLMLSL